jgi:mandelate racemase
LTLKSIQARPVVLKLKRPVIARIATLTDWPLILIDLYTEEGVIGRAYLKPYIPKSMRYLLPALHDLGEMLKGRRLAPVELYDAARKSLHFVGYEGMSMIAVAGVDMAAWDALTRAAGVPLCVLLGGRMRHGFNNPNYNACLWPPVWHVVWQLFSTRQRRSAVAA